MKPDAKNAISILNALLEIGEARLLAYWTTPNVILTLSGARAYCDGVYWGNMDLLKKWNGEIENSLEVLEHNWPLVLTETGIKAARPEENYASFELISEVGLRQAIGQTKLVDHTILEVLLQQASFKGLLKEMTQRLQEQSKFKDYSKENINDVAFGILLGYPDDAIVGSVIEWQKDDPFAEPLIDADIRGAGYYICPRPVYSYPRSLISSPAISENEQLWSKILKDYYTSDFHRKLEARADFQQKLKELGNLR
jgi:hypothetical protein